MTWAIPEIAARYAAAPLCDLDAIASWRAPESGVPVKIPEDIQLSVLKLLSHSWKGIDYQWRDLTRDEKRCISREHFDHLVELMVSEGVVS